MLVVIYSSSICQIQVKYIFGYSQYVIPETKTAKAKTITFPRHDPIQEQLRDLLGHEWTPYFHWREFIMGSAFIFILLAMKFIGQRYPRSASCATCSRKIYDIFSANYNNL